jgi:hypothetical protein
MPGGAASPRGPAGPPRGLEARRVYARHEDLAVAELPRWCAPRGAFAASRSRSSDHKLGCVRTRQPHNLTRVWLALLRLGCPGCRLARHVAARPEQNQCIGLTVFEPTDLRATCLISFLNTSLARAAWRDREPPHNVPDFTAVGKRRRGSSRRRGERRALIAECGGRS